MKHMRSRSLNVKITSLIAAITIPLIVIIFSSNLYSMKLVRNQIIAYNNNILGMYINQLDTDLEKISDYILYSNIHSNDINSNDVRLSYIFLLNVQTEFRDALNLHSRADGFFIYDKQDERFAYTHGGGAYGANYADRAGIKEYIMDLDTEKNYLTWYGITVNENHYLIFVIRTETVTAGAWISIAEIMNEIESLQVENMYSIRISTESFIDERIISGDLAKINQLNLSKPSQKSDAVVYIDFNEYNIMSKLSIIQQIIIVFSIFSIACIPLGFIFTRHIILHPIEKIKGTIAELKNGNCDARINTRSKITEFELMEDAFNELIDEAQSLRIHVYEDQLIKQRIELQLLYSQIKPHFFLNVINNFSNYAIVKEYEQIRELSQLLSNYVRYTFNHVSCMETLRHEVEHVRNYIELQKMRYPDNILFKTNLQPSTLDIPIPSLVIQTLVENIFKHARNEYGVLSIGIESMLSSCDDKHNLVIIIRDNGNGFSEDAMNEINSEPNSTMNDKIGIWNIKQRIALCYHKRANMVAENNNGAQLTIVLPLDG